MNDASDPLTLSAREAAAELAVTPATLYAYVSRGLIRSEPSVGSRARRYRAEDVRALKNRRAPTSPDGGAPAETPLVETAVATIGPRGPVYRGVDAVGLAAHATLETVATLLWDANATDPFARDNLPAIDPAMRELLAACRDRPPLVRAMAVLSLAAEADPRAFVRTAEGRAQMGARIMRLAAVAILGSEPSAEPLHHQVARALAPGNADAPDLVRRALVLLADHELNASTYTVRCAVSTGGSLHDATIAGLAALKGPRHGGAGALAAGLVAALDASDIRAAVRLRVATGDSFPGFGHSVYPDRDPRADALLSATCRIAGAARLADEAPRLVTEATGLAPNVDFALATMSRVLALPAGSELSIFAIARFAGWIAHAMEQLATGRLIRPRARYVGPSATAR